MQDLLFTFGLATNHLIFILSFSVLNFVVYIADSAETGNLHLKLK